MTKHTFAVLLVLFTAGVFLYLSSVASQFGLSVLLHDPASIRGSEINYMAAFPLYGKILFYLGPLCLILVLFPRLVDGLESIRGRWILACLLVVAQLATLQRTNLFVVAAWACGLLILRAVTRDGTANDAPRRWAVPLLLSVAAALLVFQVLAVALGKTGNNNPAVSAFVDEPLRSSPYLSLPFYASSGIPAFDQLTRSDDDSYPPPRVGARPVYGEYNPQTWGRATFAGPLKVVPTRRWEEVAPFTAVPEPTNVYTWLEPWYRDFRGPGVLIGSAAIGFILSRLASRSFRSPHTYLAAGLLLGFSGLATFINRYMSVMSVVLYGTIWILGRLWSARISRATSAPIIERTR